MTGHRLEAHVVRSGLLHWTDARRFWHWPPVKVNCCCALGLPETTQCRAGADVAVLHIRIMSPVAANVEFANHFWHNHPMTPSGPHDAYIAAAPADFHDMLGQLRDQLARALPDATPIVKYDMPGFQIGSAIIAGYAAFTKQCGLYVDAKAIAAHADDIAAEGLKATKTGVTFSPKKPISGELVEKLAHASRAANGF